MSFFVPMAQEQTTRQVVQEQVSKRAKPSNNPRVALARWVENTLGGLNVVGSIIYNVTGSQATVRLPDLELGVPVEFTVKTPEEASESDKKLAAQAALQALPSWLSALSQDDLGRLKQRRLERTLLVRSQDKKGQLSEFLHRAFGERRNPNYSMISNDNSTGASVFVVALKVEALEEGGAPSEFYGVSNTRKAAEQQAAQAALSELQPRLEMLAAKRRAAPKKNKESVVRPKQVAGAKVELTAEVKAEVQAAVKAAVEAAAKLAATGAATEPATAPAQTIADKVADFAREIIAQLDTEGKSVELDLSGWRLKFLLPTLAKLPQRLQATAQLRPAEGIASDAQQYVLRVTRDAPTLSSGANATHVAYHSDSQKLAESLRAQFDGMTSGEAEQSSGTINIVFSNAGDNSASVNAIKALAILQSTFSQEDRSVKFAPRYTLIEDKGIVVPGIAVALAVA